MKAKRFFALALCALMLFSCIPAFSVSAEDELPVISWFVSGMTVGEAKELSPALKSFTRGGNTLDDSEPIASGDTVVTDNASYTAWVLGDVAGVGKVDQYSYILIRRHCFNTYTLNEQESFSADINKDGTIDEYDYILARRIYFSTFALAKPKNSDGVPVLLYHHILPDEYKNTDHWRGNDITIATSEFRRHLQMLTDGGYNVVTADEVVAYVRGEILLPDKSIMLCFDDGYRSNTYFAAPILDEFGFKATVFSIICGYENAYVEEYDYYALQKITPEDLAPWEEVIDQQCHTYANHNQLHQQSYNQIYSDLMQAQSTYACEYFAYPYGKYNDTATQAVKDAGFLAAFTTVERNSVPGDDVFLIPRYTVTSPMSDADYLKLIAKAD